MSSSKKILESELLSRYLAHFGEPLPPVLTGDAADWVKEDFIRQALRRVQASIVETPSRPSSTPGRPPLGPRPSSTTARPARGPSTTPPPTPLLDHGPRALSALTDERLDTAPEGVRDARRRLRGLIPEASRLHLELVVAARDPTAENNKEKAHKLKARRAKLVEKLCEVLDERDSLWAVIEDYLTKADE